MSKGAAIVASGAGLIGAAATGAYALGAFEDSNVVPTTLKEFKEGSGITCLGDYFPDLSLVSLDNHTNSREITSTNQLETTFFTSTSSQHLTPKSCLIVNWEKQNFEVNKWGGNFRWMGAFVNGDQGMIMFNSLETHSNEAKLNAFGGIYFLQKDSNKKGIVHKYKELQSSSVPSIQVIDFDQKFPKVGQGIVEKNKFKANSRDYWGFMSKSSDLNNICLSSDTASCHKNILLNTEGFRGRWEGVQDSYTIHNPIDWVQLPYSGLAKVYSDLSNFNSCSSSCFADMKGKWVVKSISGTGID